jgi:predicted secreted acid phosphatase
MKRIVLLVLTIGIFSGCSSSLQNLSVSKKEVSIYYESGAYNKELKEIINSAISDLKGIDVHDSTAVVFDVDETSLSNYSLIKSLDFGYIPKLWDEWVLQARAPAIGPVKDLYDVLISRKIKIIFLTGRKPEEYDATYKNLVEAGYTKFDTLIVRNPDMSNASAANYKRIERIVLNAMGYKIAACVGDQDSDFIGENTGIMIKLPNYLYTIQ